MDHYRYHRFHQLNVETTKPMKISKLIFVGVFGLIFLATSCLDGTEDKKIEKSILGKWEIIEQRTFSNEKLNSTRATSGDFLEFKADKILTRTNPAGSISTFDYRIIDNKFLEFEAEEFGTIKTIQFEVSFKSGNLMVFSRILSPPYRHEFDLIRRN